MSQFKNLFSLEGKKAIVTGASRGLGKAMAVGMAEAGADVAALSTNADNCSDTLKKIEATGRNGIAISCDQSNKKQVKMAVKKAIEEFGRIDILINNAGTIRRSPAIEFSDEDWEFVISTNLNGVFQFCREVGKTMVERGSGKIINIASLLSFQGGITVPAYAASKGGVAQLTKALANEWAKFNVQVNAIAPGYFSTDNTQALQDDPVRNEQIMIRIPAGRWGKPEDMVGTAIFLSSSASDYVNGHVLLVDGGWMAR
jgi:2-dehydro-3-deoxy-D-gluconate 5-dehydrogenase